MLQTFYRHPIRLRNRYLGHGHVYANGGESKLMGYKWRPIQNTITFMGIKASPFLVSRASSSYDTASSIACRRQAPMWQLLNVTVTPTKLNSFVSWSWRNESYGRIMQIKKGKQFLPQLDKVQLNWIVKMHLSQDFLSWTNLPCDSCLSNLTHTTACQTCGFPGEDSATWMVFGFFAGYFSLSEHKLR